MELDKMPELQEGYCLYPKPNPLLMECILDIIASNLSLRDIRQCVLVSKLWRNEFIRNFKKRLNIIVVHKHYDESNKLLNRKAKNDDNYANIHRLSLNYLPVNSPYYRRYFTYFGTNLTFLALVRCTVDGSMLRKYLNSYCPNLQAFELLSSICTGEFDTPFFYCDEGDPHERKENCQESDEYEAVFSMPHLRKLKYVSLKHIHPDSSLKAIANVCPNLVELTINQCPVPDPRDFYTPMWTSLRKLSIAPVATTKLGTEYLTILSNMALKLESLELFSMEMLNRTRRMALKRVLTYSAPVLETLGLWIKLEGMDWNCTSLHEYNFPNLKNLHISPFIFPSLAMLDNCPKLQTFSCRHNAAYKWIKTVHFGLPENPLNGITHLELGQIFPHSLKILSHHFPCVTMLYLHADYFANYVLRAVVSGFPNLIGLRFSSFCTGSDMDDSGITGFTEAQCQLFHQWDNISQPPPQSGRMFGYIGALKELKDLQISKVSSQLTDLSVQFGIRHLAKLCSLDISNSKITDKSLQIFGAGLPNLTTLIINDCPYITSTGVKALKSARRNMTIFYVMH